MKVLSALSSEKYSTQREQWEDILKAELKLTELGRKDFKRTIDGGEWRTLSLSTKSPVELGVGESWKKASQTYWSLSGTALLYELKEDLSSGVRNFFFSKAHLSSDLWAKVKDELESVAWAQEMEVFLLGQGPFDAGETKFKLFDESNFIIGRFSHDLGGSAFQELALMACELIEKIEEQGPIVHLAVFTDSQFFRNIAKLRAAKLLAMKVFEEIGLNKKITLIALSSYREWTFYERYSNMLRNNAAVASSYIGGGDYIQSSGYNLLFEFKDEGGPEHRERSKRMARNTCHILGLEALLGVVHDPAFGSYHLEGMTQQYAEESWKLMQQLLSLSKEDRAKKVREEATMVAQRRLKELRSRKFVMAGINDFPDPAEKLDLFSLAELPFFRIAECLESLRIRMETSRRRPTVTVGVFGDYAALNTRLNFVKNYFQLLGLGVHEVTCKEELSKKEDIVVLCARDVDYPDLVGMELKAKAIYLAGKFEAPGHQGLFAGQDVYSVLEAVVKEWGDNE